MSDLSELQKIIIDFCEKRNWKQFHNPKDLAISLVLESGEFLEHFQWKNEAELKSHLTKYKKEVSEELADVLYWVLLIASYQKIDLEIALKDKMKVNEIKYPVGKSKNNHKKYTEL